MFGMFKPQMAPEGPVEIDMDIEIERSADDVYAMLDFGDPRNHKAGVGTITRTGPKSFTMVLDMLPDLVFPIVESEARPGRVYTIESVLPEGLGHLRKTIERSEIEALGPDRCKVTLKMQAEFAPMKLKHYHGEVTRIAMACNNSLAKLKVHAEQGVEAIREIEARQVS